LKKLDEQESKKLSRKDLLEKMKEEYIPVRERDKKKRELKQGTFDGLTKNLVEWELIDEEFIRGSKKEKEYKITLDGEFALKFVFIRQKKKEE